MWFVYGYSLEVIKNECKKFVERVVTTKHDIYNYLGHLHVDIQNVQILSNVYVGDKIKAF